MNKYNKLNMKVKVKQEIRKWFLKLYCQNLKELWVGIDSGALELCDSGGETCYEI